MSAIYLLNNEEYKETCYQNSWVTPSEKYFKTTAETTYRFIKQKEDFEEAHTALEDAQIESEIFSAIHKKSKGKWEYGIIYFPFRILGTVENYEILRK